MSILAEYRDLRVSVDPQSETVEVVLRTPAPACDAWRAITEPPQVRRWLGTLWAPLAVGTSSRLDFGDGDFFTLRVQRLEPPRRVDYDWRFLGIGPSCRITWTVDAIGDCECEITVSDRQRGRSRDETLALAAGWSDFCTRLARFIATGAWSRYAWRGEVDASVLLPVDVATARVLFDRRGQAAWLPVSRAGLVVGTTFALDGNEELSVLHAERPGPDSWAFEIGRPEWSANTRCALALSPRGRRTLLEVHHFDFRALPIDEGRKRRLRQSAVRGWRSALQRSRAAAALANGNNGT
jgi:uncharacterized protein YndB with AHSA1/START domain